MFKNLFISIVLILIISPLLSNNQQERHITRYEVKGQEILKKASEKMKTGNDVLRIDFTYIIESDENDLYDTNTGKTFLHKKKYNILMDDYLYISDGHLALTFLKDVGEVHVNYLENVEQSMNPAQLLDDFKSHYRAKLIREENYNSKIVYLVDAIPNEPQAFFKYRVAVDSKNHELVFIKAYDRHGGTYKIQIDEIKRSSEIPEEKFEINIDKYKKDRDIDFIDLR